ncbi:uncharacterized protein ACA1_337330 [Acanthamoeba castellanii str. Neff]|uniref:Uncharacterized protein n=1 Tax=Acanthamoeba castellanii (strain ATCC 30010 / Neff) TaxID=1257118 RepID=L8HAX7_ACACF|nr:uncharacterized protein ACA1_337330 [Acanthamoeba castellanii str. Neff]ELR21883.1 hypothetical protein ACA1_337330 [Acanthamoeba castellanii str. Neff]
MNEQLQPLDVVDGELLVLGVLHGLGVLLLDVVLLFSQRYPAQAPFFSWHFLT